MTRIDAGTFIVFEGIDGAGKSHLVEFVAEHLRKQGRIVKTSHEPTHGLWGMKLRASAATGRLSVAEELHCLTEDRRQHVREVILPALARNETVILDRYFYSTIAYQGSRGGDVEAIAAAMTNEFPIPDVVFLIDVPAEVGLARISHGRGEVPNQFEQLDALRAAREVFLNIAARHTNIVTVDGARPVEDVRETIMKHLAERHLPR